MQHIDGRDLGGSVRTVRAYMSDDHVLQRKSFLKPDGTTDFSDGWKDLGRLKKPLHGTVHAQERLDAIRTSLLEKGWTEVKEK